MLSPPPLDTFSLRGAGSDLGVIWGQVRVRLRSKTPPSLLKAWVSTGAGPSENVVLRVEECYTTCVRFLTVKSFGLCVVTFRTRSLVQL